MLIRIALIPLMFLALAATGSHWQLAAQDTVRIAFRETASTSASVVTIGDLAKLDGGSNATRNAMAALDVEAGVPGEKVQLGRRSALARLLVAGYRPSDFEFEGAEHVQVHFLQPMELRDAVGARIREHVSATLGVDEVDIEVECDVLDSGARAEASADDEIRLENPPPASRIPGNGTLTAAAWREGARVEQFRVAYTVSVYREVAVAGAALQRGVVLGPENSRLERRRFTARDFESFAGSSSRGKALARNLAAGETIRARDLSEARANEIVLIRPRDLVTATTGSGGFQVTITGMEAMRQGKAGDTIPLRNPGSGKIIYGRVISATQVQVSW
jgi:flagella basal body P-ring formation protein FlgA